MDFSLILIRVFASDWDRAVRFYTEVLEIPLAERQDELGWAELDTGACRIALEKMAPDDADRAAIAAEPDENLLGRFVAISQSVSNIYATNGVDDSAAANPQVVTYVAVFITVYKTIVVDFSVIAQGKFTTYNLCARTNVTVVSQGEITLDVNRCAF